MLGVLIDMCKGVSDWRSRSILIGFTLRDMWSRRSTATLGQFLTTGLADAYKALAEFLERSVSCSFESRPWRVVFLLLLFQLILLDELILLNLLMCLLLWIHLVKTIFKRISISRPLVFCLRFFLLLHFLVCQNRMLWGVWFLETAVYSRNSIGRLLRRLNWNLDSRRNPNLFFDILGPVFNSFHFFGVFLNDVAQRFDTIGDPPGHPFFDYLEFTQIRLLFCQLRSKALAVFESWLE